MSFQSRHQQVADLYKNQTANDEECRPPANARPTWQAIATSLRDQRFFYDQLVNFDITKAGKPIFARNTRQCLSN